MSDRWETVPAGTKPEKCKGSSCGQTIYMIERPSAAAARAAAVPDLFPALKRNEQLVRVPVDCDVIEGRHPTATRPGRGVNHYTTCPNSDDF